MYPGRSTNPFAVPDWAAMFAPRRSKKRGRPFQVGEGDPTEFVRQMTEAYNAIYAPMLENLMTYWGGSTASPWTSGVGASWPGLPDPMTRRRGRKRRHDCGCDDGDCDGCHHDNCHCRCCITDADLVVHARLGEGRVVPLTIENPRSRERQVRLELSNWTARSGSPANVTGIILPPTEFTLGPCSEREVVIGVQVGFRESDATRAEANREPFSTDAGLARMAERVSNADARGRLPDVEHCEVYYADLRAEGCDIRPIRIAAVVLPRDCDAHPIDCGCGCC